MKVMMRLREATSWNPEAIVLCGGEGHDMPILMLRPVSLGHTRIPDARVKEIVMELLTRLDEVEFEIPGEVDDYVEKRMPGWAAAVSGGATKVRIAGAPGEIRIPDGAKFLPDGEIEVPARSLDGSSPAAKQFRRACRKARNAIRELAASSGKTVELIMLEIRGEKS